MAALCDRIELLLSDMNTLLPECSMGYALEPEEVLMVRAVVDIARKAGQVKGSRMVWSHNGEWFLFKNSELGISCTMVDTRPEWVVKPVKAKLVPIYVPEHLVAAMRLHLGELANA